MPRSLRENDQEVLDFVLAHDIQTVLDVGPGEGTYWAILHDHVSRMEAVEVWAPYIRRFNLDDKYDEVTVGDIRDIAWASGPNVNKEYDLIIFGDVLEHMTSAESQEVWQWAHGHARWGLISVPIVHWPQGAEEGNPFEAHVQEHLEWPHVVEVYGPFQYMHIYGQTATFIKEFK